MQPRKSEIFEAYAKLAEEKGLVKTAASEEKESPEIKKYKSEAYARVGSDSISTIEALYGVKCETIEGMEYEKNIVEVAHPKAVVIAPSYDKINGLVENINERHNIIVNKIMSKAPSGSLFLLKDAQKELTMGLIRIANDADNADEDEIRQLADDCLEELKKTAGWWDDIGDFAHKAVNYVGGGKGDKFLSDFGGVGEGALAGAVAGAGTAALLGSWTGPGEIAIIPAGAILGGIIGYIFNTSPKIKNIKENATDLLNQLNDLKKSVPEEGAFFTMIEGLMEKLIKSSDAYLSALNMVRAKEVKNEPVSEAEKEEIKKDSKEFVDLIATFQKAKKMYSDKVKEGAFAKSLNSIPHPGIANDIEDVTDSFNSLAVAIDNLKSTMTGVVEKAKEESKPAAPSPIKQESGPAANSTGFGKMYEDFVAQLGHKPDSETMDFMKSLQEFGKK